MNATTAHPLAASFPRNLLAGSPVAAARALLGAVVVRDASAGPRSGRVVDVEAYGAADDAASHAHRGRTQRNAAMFLGPGTAYVFSIYGMHRCLNVVTGPPGTAGAVLIRALEPLLGEEGMRAALARRRGHGDGTVDRRASHGLARGPGLVGAAFEIDLACGGLDLCDPSAPLRLLAGTATVPAAMIASGPRVGINGAGEPARSRPWRFWIAGHPSVSGRRDPATARSAALS